MRAAFQTRGFTRLYLGLLASMVGDSLMLIVLAVWVKDLTGSSGAAGLTFFCLAIPALFAPLIGVYVDRVRRRTFLIWGNLASAVAVLPLLGVRSGEDVWLIYFVAFLYGISFIALPSALNGLLKELLPEELLVDANASLSTTREALRLVGPLIGAGLFTVIGGAGVGVIDAVSFLVAAVMVYSIAVREDLPEREEGHWRDEFLAGIRHIRRDAVLLHTMVSVGVSLLVIGFMESAVFAMVDAFDKPANFVGVVVSVQGVGAVAGGLLSARIIRRIGESTAVAVTLAAFGLGLAICAATRELSVIFVGTVELGFALPVFIVAFNTLLQKRTPQRLMGRVSAAADVILGTPQACSIAVGALLVSVLTYREIYWLSAVVIVAAAAYLPWALRGVDAHVAELEEIGTDPDEAAPGQVSGEPASLPPRSGC